MIAPAYSLRLHGVRPNGYLRAVAQLADEVLAAGRGLDRTVEAYGDFAEATGRETRRSFEEYLLEALALGVLWRQRGEDATRRDGAGPEYAEVLAARRRAGGPRPRDGSASILLSLDAPFEPAHPRPSVGDVDRLLAWLLASGEYNDEVARLDGWRAFLSARWDAETVLAEAVAYATKFELWSLDALGPYTAGVERLFRDDLPRRRWREDTVQCARRRSEYHLGMVGAEILNRAWRADFLACERHVVVLPGCARRRGEGACEAESRAGDLHCTACTARCAVAAATQLARRAGAEAVAVVHGSDFSSFLRSPALRGGRVGIVGVACAPGILGAGWRARAAGLPAQCVLLDASGCRHWRDAPVPTTLDLCELARILEVERPAAGTGRWGVFQPGPAPRSGSRSQPAGLDWAVSL